ncbi:unnamed protein product, partial [Staurois parvus]
MCNFSVSDDMITIPQLALLALICVSVGGGVLCVLAGLPAVTAFYLPPSWGIPSWDHLSECGSIILHSLQLSPCHCQPQIQSICDTDFVFNIDAGGILWH